ncbi:MAG: AAA family ATPase [Armatimonadota bacterium]|nr:MAG: AAA family ATPase [Armatimonadota bacterium]
MARRLRTFLSPVRYRRPDGELGALLDVEGNPVCWLDSLLGGGIVIPDDVEDGSGSPLVWLVTGPPGTGKSVFALEFCYRLATQPQDDGDTVGTVYFSAESPATRIGKNMADLGWKNVVEAQLNAALGQGDPPNIRVIGRDTISSAPLGPAGDFFRSLGTVHCPAGTRVVVLDSLNVLNPHWEPGEIVEGVQQGLPNGVWVVIVVQDWMRGHDPYYAFIADIETRFEEVYRKDYLLRTFRIVKMRWQDHTQGRHIVKIYGAPSEQRAQTRPRAPAMERVGLDREHGGVFVFPSVHRHLAAWPQRANASKSGVVPVPVPGMEHIMPAGTSRSSGTRLHGFPKGRCTALIGGRGALKSHLAYYTLLSTLEDRLSLAVLLSLRDDWDAAHDTLEQICHDEQCKLSIPDLIEGHDARLDIAYFRPGYIPPEEFMHRVVVAIDGLIARQGGRAAGELLVVVNGLDHLAARHPLCAEEDMFVSAVLSYLCERGVTSLVTAATEGPAQGVSSGLLPMADLLLHFDPLSPKQAPPECPKEAHQIVEVVALRVPAGGTSRQRGYLYRKRMERDRLGFALASGG